MADIPGRKADLDKDGIVFSDAGKAELDKEGISLEQGESLTKAGIAETPSDQEPGKKTSGPKRLFIMAGAGAAGFILVLAVIGYLFWHSEPEPPKVAHKAVPKKESPFGPEGMVLDPFMVLFEAPTPKKAGVLVAQVSLKVDPAMAASIQSKLFDIRNIIYRRLLAAANVYSPTEITLMLSDDLMDYPIQEVAFVQYNAK